MSFHVSLFHYFKGAIHIILGWGVILISLKTHGSLSPMWSLPGEHRHPLHWAGNSLLGWVVRHTSIQLLPGKLCPLDEPQFSHL